MDLLSAESGTIFWTTVTFALLLVVLWRFAWGPILGALEAREEAIQRTIDDAERLHAEAEALLQEHEKKLAETRQAGNRILDEARQAGENLKQDVLEKARGEADQILARAGRRIELETEEALQTIRAQAADLALRAAEKILERTIDDADHRRLTDEAVAELVEKRG